MDERAKEARRAYKRAWSRKNADKVKQYQARYWAKKAAEQSQAERTDESNHENEQKKRTR